MDGDSVQGGDNVEDNIYTERTDVQMPCGIGFMEKYR